MKGGALELLRTKILRTAIFAMVIVLVLLLIYFTFITTMPELIPLLRDGDEVAIETYLRSNNNIQGFICLAILQMLQIISVVISGTPIQIAAGIVYGVWRAFIICHLSTVAASAGMFAFLRKTGEKMDKYLPVRNSRMSKLDFIMNSERPTYTLTVAYLIPIIPNGLIPILAVKSKVTFKRFVLAVYTGTLLPLFIMCAIGQKILKGDYLFAGIIFAVLIILIWLLSKYRKQVLAWLDKYVPFISKEK